MARYIPFYQQRERDIARVGDQAVQPTRVSGRILVKEPGELLAEVQFPVYFSERPALSFGAEMDTDFVPVDGDFPTVSCLVSKWVREERPADDESTPRFVGAELCIVTTGIDGQQMWIHWNVEGKALRSPVRFIDNSGTTLTETL